jgi:hypothetical protein
MLDNQWRININSGIERQKSLSGGGCKLSIQVGKFTRHVYLAFAKLAVENVAK